DAVQTLNPAYWAMVNTYEAKRAYDRGDNVGFAFHSVAASINAAELWFTGMDGARDIHLGVRSSMAKGKLRGELQHVAGSLKSAGGNHGPVLGAVMDLMTTEIYFSLNEDGLHVSWHPTLEPRVQALKKSPMHFTEAGTHGEALALNKALWGREFAGMATDLTNFTEFMLDTVWLKGKGGRMQFGAPAPRCGNCAGITVGTRSLPGDAPPKPPKDDPWQ
ncbi:MAG TPA: hypothetical protein VL172_10205, partial [Kofleriaceae bacterium]|nr:hypothetical protein [Kofleriaceae bacterium]